MSVLSRLGSLWRALTHRSSFEADMEEEFRLHLELRTEDLIRSGVPPAQAARQARIEFGSSEVHKEQARASRGLRFFDELYGDLRYGMRTLKRTPGFTVVAVLTLALGIGATTAMFSVTDTVLRRPLPFRDAGGLVELTGVVIPAGLGLPTGPSYMPRIKDVRALGVFQDVAVYAPGGLNLSGGGGPQRIAVAAVTPGFFRTLGVSPALGRGFVPEEGVPGGPDAAVVSWALWRQRLGADRALIGQHLTLNGRGYQVVGVAPRGFVFPSKSQVWIPLQVPTTPSDLEPFRQYMPYKVIARLGPEVSLDGAGRRVSALFAPAVAKIPNLFESRPPVLPFRSVLVGDRRRSLLLLLGATVLVLVIACANVANLLLSKATVRQREITVRATLGATPGRVVRQLLLESLLLALMGGAVGVGVALGGTHAVAALVPPVLVGSVPVRIDERVLSFALVLTFGVGLAFGIAPALSARRPDAADVLKGGSIGTMGGGGSAGVRRALLLVEVALTVTLLVGSGVMLRSLHALLDTDSGVQPEHVVTLRVTLARELYPDPEDQRHFYQGVLDRLKGLPGLEAAGWVNELPLSGEGAMVRLVAPEGENSRELGRDMRNFPEDLQVTPDYFRAMGIRILAGRPPRARPDGQGGSREVAVNQTMAHFEWPGEVPMGRVLERSDGAKLEVVGVVADVRPTTLASDLTPQIYSSLLQGPRRSAALVAHGYIRTSVLERRIVQAVHDVAPHQAVYDVRTMDDVIRRAIGPRRANTALVTAFGIAALLLAGVGVYGVISFGVASRTQEIGIRMALGADSGRIRRGVAGEALGMAAIGSLLGLGCAWAVSGVLRAFVYGVAPTDPLSFAAAPAVVLVAAALAAFVPARRATRVSPTDAIRDV